MDIIPVFHREQGDFAACVGIIKPDPDTGGCRKPAVSQKSDFEQRPPTQASFGSFGQTHPGIVLTVAALGEQDGDQQGSGAEGPDLFQWVILILELLENIFFDDKRKRSCKLVDFHFVFVSVVLYGEVTKSTP